MTTLALDLIRFPKRYIHERIDGKIVLNYQQIARDAMRENSTLDPAKWPFPPILVRPVTVDAAKKGDKPITVYEIMDGAKRTRAAQALKLDKIPATIQKADDSEAALAQLTENARHGQVLDRDKRNAWIKYLARDLKLSTRRIAAAIGLSQPSVSRIIAGRQATGETGARKLAAQRRRRGAGRASQRRVEWTPTVFLREFEALVREFEQHQAEITEAVAQMDRDLKVSQPFLTWVGSLTATR